MKKTLIWLLTGCLVLGNPLAANAELLTDGSDTYDVSTETDPFFGETFSQENENIELSESTSDNLLITENPSESGNESDAGQETGENLLLPTDPASSEGGAGDMAAGSAASETAETEDALLSGGAEEVGEGETEGESEEKPEEDDSKIRIIASIFPDSSVRRVVTGFDSDEDGYLSLEEREAVTALHLSSLDYGRTITSLEGLENFPNVTWLDVSYNNFKELDLSVFPKLVYLNCSKNALTSLDLSNHPALERVHCQRNSLTSLNLKGDRNLVLLNCNENQLRSLSMQDTPNLKWFSCESNSLTYLNVSKLSNLLTLNCSSNSLNSLDVSRLTGLTSLTVNQNHLTGLDLKEQRSLSILSCQKNSITSLNLQYCRSLTYLDCSENRLKTLDLSKNTALVTVDVRMNLMASMAAVSGRADGISVFYFHNQRENDSLKTDITSLTNVAGGVQVRWSKASGAEKYTIYRKTSEDPWTKWQYLATISNTNQTTYIDKTVASGTTYQYRVRASNVNTEEYSIDRVGLSIQYLSIPKFLASTNRPTGIYIRWSESYGAARYVVYRKTEGGSWQNIANISGSKNVEYVDETVNNNNGVIYYYTVRAFGLTDKSAYSDTGRITCRLRKPGMSVYKPLTGNRAGFSWSVNGKATGYYLQYSTDPSFKDATTVNIKGYKKNSCTVKNLKAKTKYYVRVQVYRIQNGYEFRSAQSGTRSFVTY
ncbi:MAG: fibronectin type III domain-containing protein [Eubacteriales bacterium]|nr:fibronectin type III domain-containing protein [Eubacteriales bacterium]